MHRWRRRLAPLVFAAVAPPCASQEPLDLPGVFSEVIDVRVINVEVVVTDEEGSPVHGLGRDDFRLLVDGAERDIDFWSEIREGEPTGGDAPADTHSTSYLLFIDDAFTLSRDRDRVLDELVRDLSHLGPRDRMAVVAFDGRELTQLSPWTRSRRVLAGALRAARARPADGRRRQRERRFNDLAGGGVAGRTLSGIQHRYAARLGNQIQRAVMAAVASLRSFASPPGRKVMLILSGGWPVSPAEYAITRGSYVEEAIEGAYDAGVLGYEALYGPLVDTANLLGYTLYPVDVAGIAGRIDPEIPVGLLSEAGDRSFTGRRGNLHAGMRFLAEKTGGLAVIRETRARALQEVAADTRSYYSLGFRVDRDADGGRHDLAVEVQRPGLEARARQSFVDMSRHTDMTLMTESALLFGNPASALPAQLRFGPSEPAGGGLVRLGVEVGFPVDGIPLARSAGRYTADLPVRIVGMDERGVRLAPRETTVHIELERPPRPGELYWYSSELEIEPCWHRIVAGVFDPKSGRIYSSAAEIVP